MSGSPVFRKRRRRWFTGAAPQVCVSTARPVHGHCKYSSTPNCRYCYMCRRSTMCRTSRTLRPTATSTLKSPRAVFGATATDRSEPVGARRHRTGEVSPPRHPGQDPPPPASRWPQHRSHRPPEHKTDYVLHDVTSLIARRTSHGPNIGTYAEPILDDPIAVDEDPQCLPTWRTGPPLRSPRVEQA